MRRIHSATSSVSASKPCSLHAAPSRRDSARALGQRVSMFRSSAEATASSIAGWIDGSTVRRRGGVSVATLSSVATSSSTGWSRLPASTSQAMTPAAHTSQRRSMSEPRACSGDM